MADFEQLLLSLFVLIALFLLVYIGIRKQSLSETWDEMKEMFASPAEEVGETLGTIRK